MKRLSWSRITVLCGIGVIFSSNSLFGADRSDTDTDTDKEFSTWQIGDITTLRANLEQVPHAFSEGETATIRALLPQLANTPLAPDPSKTPPDGQRNILTQAAENKIREGLGGLSELGLDDDEINDLLLAINYGVLRDQTSLVGGEVGERTQLIYNALAVSYFENALETLLEKKSQGIKG